MERNIRAGTASTCGRQHSIKNSGEKKLPVNLLKKAQREQRCREGSDRKTKSQKAKKYKLDFERSEHEALVQATEAELRKILENEELLSDIPYDCTPEELLGEIAIAKGHATTIYLQRDGLSTLTIVLPQAYPTIANLKRAIEATARVQLKRELRQRHEERLKRRSDIAGRATTTKIAAGKEHSDSFEVKEEEEQQPAVATPAIPSTMVADHIRNTGELVYSTARSGQQHRPNVSWRFLWRVYALFNKDTNLPINDENGRKLLSECGIENATTLKFCNREKYFQRKRQ